jgi:hypothetical protein
MSWLRLMEQQIKEGKSNSDENSENLKNKPLVKKHKVLSLIKEMWPAYLIEIFVIILGISISLGLEQWRDDTRESKLERIYQKNLLVDVNADLQSLKYASDNTQNLINKGNLLIEFIKEPVTHPVTSNQLTQDIQIILGRPNFISSDATFYDLQNSGSMHLLKDLQLKNILFLYYHQTQSIKESQNAEQQATINISGSYFLKRFPLVSIDNQHDAMSKSQIDELSKDMEFENNVLLRVTNRQELLGKYERALDLGTQLKNLLAKEVNK